MIYFSVFQKEDSQILPSVFESIKPEFFFPFYSLKNQQNSCPKLSLPAIKHGGALYLEFSKYFDGSQKKTKKFLGKILNKNVFVECNAFKENLFIEFENWFPESQKKIKDFFKKKGIKCQIQMSDDHVFLYLNYQKNHKFFFKSINNQEIWVQVLSSNIDLENLENILNGYNGTNATKIIQQFNKIGIKVIVENKKKTLFILKSHENIIKKNNSKDPLGVGDTTHKKYIKSNFFSDIADGFEISKNALDLFVFSYFVSTGRKINYNFQKSNETKTFVDFQELSTPIAFIKNHFLDEDQCENFQHVQHQINSKSLSKTENICLKLMAKFMGDSTHLLMNLGGKDCKGILKVLKSMGYLHANLLQKTYIHYTKPNYEPTHTGIVFSLILGKKSKLKDIMIVNEDIPVSLKKKIHKYLLNIYREDSLLLFDNNELNKTLKIFGVTCSKIKVLNLSDQKFCLQLWIDYEKIEKFLQNLKFFEFPLAQKYLFMLSQNAQLSIGLEFNESKLNDLKEKLKNILGCEVSHEVDTDKGTILSLFCGEKPHWYKKVDTFLRASPKEGMVLSFLQLQFYSLWSKPLKSIIIPEISTEITGGNMLQKLQLGLKIENEYITESNIHINLVLQGTLKLANFMKNIFDGGDSVTDYLCKLNFKKNNYNFFGNISTNQGDIFKQLLEKNHEHLFFVSNNDVYLSGFGVEKELKIPNFDNNVFFISLKGNNPLGLDFIKNVGIKLDIKHLFSVMHLGNLFLNNILFGFSPKYNTESLFNNLGENRVPGYPSLRINKFILCNRSMMLKEIWNSSEVFVKMFSLFIGLTGNAGIAFGFKDFKDYISNKTQHQLLLNGGGIIILDLLGAISLFFSITFDWRGDIIIDMGVIYSLNNKAKDQLTQDMQL